MTLLDWLDPTMSVTEQATIAYYAAAFGVAAGLLVLLVYAMFGIGPTRTTRRKHRKRKKRKPAARQRGR